MSFEKIESMDNLHDGVVRCLGISQNWFVTAGYDSNITVHNLPIHHHNKIKSAHEKKIKFIHMFENGTFLTGSNDLTIILWDLKLLKILKKINVNSLAQCCLELKDFICIGSTYDKILFFEKNWTKKFELTTSHLGGVISLVDIKDGILASTSLNDFEIRIWDYKSKVLLQKLNGHKGNIYTMILHKKKNFLISGSDDTTIRIWDINQGFSCIFTIEAHTNFIQSLILYQNDFIVSSSFDCSLKGNSLVDSDLSKSLAY
jgi:WD40 repeat protein